MTTQQTWTATNFLEVVLRATRDVTRNEMVGKDDYFHQHLKSLPKVIRVVRSVQKRTGIQMSITSFALTQTIEQVCAIIVKGRNASPLCVQLRPGLGEPIFLVPGIAGAAFELRRLAATITAPGPVFGLAFPGLDGSQPVGSSLADLADILAGEMQRLGFDERHHIVGYSAGGSVAVELAQRLPADKVGLVGLIDSPVHLRHWPFRVYADYMKSRFSKNRRIVIEVPADGDGGGEADGKQPRRRSMNSRLASASTAVVRRALSAVCLVYQRFGSPTGKLFLRTFPFYVGGLPSQLQQVRDASIMVMAQSVPHHYLGPTIYFKTDEGDGLMCDPVLVWSRILPRMKLVRVPGRHITSMMDPYVEGSGRAIGRAINALQPVRSQAVAEGVVGSGAN